MPSSVAYRRKLPLSSNTTLGCTASESGLVMSFSTASLQQGSQLDDQGTYQAAAWPAAALDADVLQQSGLIEMPTMSGSS